MAQNLSELIGLDFGMKSIIIRPESMAADDTDTHTDAGNYGTGAGHIECVDFLPTGTGAVWLTIPWLSGWRQDQDVNIELTFGLSGTPITTQVLKFIMSYWFLKSGDAEPGSAAQNTDFTYTIQAADDNNKYGVHTYGTGWSADPKILKAGYSTNVPDIIIVKFTREGLHASDTYNGTMHFIKMRFFQVY